MAFMNPRRELSCADARGDGEMIKSDRRPFSFESRMPKNPCRVRLDYSKKLSDAVGAVMLGGFYSGTSTLPKSSDAYISPYHGFLMTTDEYTELNRPMPNEFNEIQRSVEPDLRLRLLKSVTDKLLYGVEIDTLSSFVKHPSLMWENQPTMRASDWDPIYTTASWTLMGDPLSAACQINTTAGLLDGNGKSLKPNCELAIDLNCLSLNVYADARQRRMFYIEHTDGLVYVKKRKGVTIAPGEELFLDYNTLIYRSQLKSKH
jgi:hypothetical protein